MSRLAGGCTLTAVRGLLSGDRSGFWLLALPAHLRCLQRAGNQALQDRARWLEMHLLVGRSLLESSSIMPSLGVALLLNYQCVTES